MKLRWIIAGVPFTLLFGLAAVLLIPVVLHEWCIDCLSAIWAWIYGVDNAEVWPPRSTPELKRTG
jgi:hypothetical protein